MPDRTFDELYAEALQLYQEGRYREVYDLWTQEGGQYPDEIATVLYLRSCMAERLGERDLAIGLIQEVVDRGLWYGEALFRQTPSWVSLQGLPEFERLVEICRSRQAVAHADSQLLVGEPEGGCSTESPCPLLMALHGNTQRAAQALDGWRAVVEMGWLLAAPNSSQGVMSDRFVWDDQDLAMREIAEHYEALVSRHAIDPERVIIAGFSMGGETALRAALRGTVPAKGFILLGPGGPTMDAPEEWLPLITGAKERDLRGYIMLGEREEPAMRESVNAMVELLNSNGIPCEFEMIPGLAHVYPPDFGPIIARALSFVEEHEE